MSNLREFTYPSSDGVHQIHAAEWTPDITEPRGVVQLVHGISEYILRYAPFAEYLTRYGFIVVGDDHLGHGKTASGPEEYGFIAEQDGWTHMADDVRALRVLTGEKYPGLPYFLLGHSMGSFLARTYLIRWPGTLTGAILSGTGQEPAPTVALGKFLTGIGNPRKVNKLVNSLSLSRMDKDTPVYFFSGDKDPVGGMGEGVRKVCGFFRDAGVKDVTLKLYPGGRHEMLNETNRDEVYADVLSWLEKHLPQ